MLRPHLLVATCGLTLATFITPPAVTAQSIQGRFDKTLSVSEPVTISVTSGSGSVDVKAGSGNAVHVIGIVRGTSWWRGATDESVQKAIKAVESRPPIVQNGSTIAIGAIDDEELARRVSISYELTVPTRTALTVKTGSGSQTIASLSGPVEASSGSGSVSVGSIEGPADVRAGSGSVTVDAARERVNVSTGSGGITLGRVAGRVTVSSGSGSVSIREAPEATIDASTGSGRIGVDGLVGGLTAHAASGSIHVNGTPKADWQLSTASGSIVLNIPDGTAFRVQATTGSGSIDSDHKLTVTRVDKRTLSGSVGSGGALVTARTSSGSIQIGR
jgi:hypothetical protein